MNHPPSSSRTAAAALPAGSLDMGVRRRSTGLPPRGARASVAQTPGQPRIQSATANRLPATIPQTVGRQGLLPKRDLLMIVTQMSIMLRSGVDLADAVRSISTRSKSPKICQVMGEVYSALERGSCLSAALAAQQHRFGGVIVALVAAGEASGRLPEVLARLSVIIRDEMRLHNSIRSAVSYPVVLLGVTALVMAGMVFFVLPQFAGIFESTEAEVPFVTQCMLDGGRFARQYWWLILGLAAAAGYGAIAFVRTPQGRRKVDQLLLRLPLLKGVCSPLLSGRLFRLQGAMLDSGVPMLEVLHLTRNSVGNHCFVELIDKVEHSIVKGDGIANVLFDSPLVPDSAADMIATGEANGQLGSVLQTVGEFYEAEGEERLRDTVKIAEPVIIVGLGLVIGAIVLSVMLPMLDVTTARGM